MTVSLGERGSDVRILEVTAVRAQGSPRPGSVRRSGPSLLEFLVVADQEHEGIVVRAESRTHDVVVGTWRLADDRQGDLGQVPEPLSVPVNVERPVLPGEGSNAERQVNHLVSLWGVTVPRSK
jgi:hypothetical protein